MIKNLALFVLETNRIGGGPNVTLLVGGSIVRGTLASALLYERWEAEILSRTALGRGHFHVPGGPIREPSEAEYAAAEAKWDAEQDQENPNPFFSRLILRNAEVVLNTGPYHMGVRPIGFPYIEIDPDFVSAWMPGSHSDSSSGEGELDLPPSPGHP